MTKKTLAPSDEYAGWQSVVRQYQQPDLRKGVWQVVNSFGGLALGLTLMYLSLNLGYWLTLLLAVPTAGFLVRIFVIQHDCGHGSFFKSRRANDLIGAVSGLFTFVPYQVWRKRHAIHHAHHAELEERGIGDVWTMTVNEYQRASWWKRASYRVFRNPLFLFVLTPAINFVILQRLPLGVQASWRTGERASVWWTNLAIACLLLVASALVGFGAVIMVGLPVMVIAASVGTWLFYVQHQFEKTYWEHTPEWDYTLAAMHGSSYYKLPRLLQWFTGNIGFHHVHHLSPRIPNYNLQRCHDENLVLQGVVKLTLASSLKTVSLALWDEEQRRLVTFREARRARREAVVSS
ncbi:MAG: fatty acid desaturase [Deinococcota bacterium]|jgi:omega-6 fatty acid desaturase (delta-12 desaturase)|nr:fatty acid desaturase [Deinococcota bacterium]MDQ3458783.1 fatty acid desaturase [Deinococcota bacterium]